MRSLVFRNANNVPSDKGQVLYLFHKQTKRAEMKQFHTLTESLESPFFLHMHFNSSDKMKYDWYLIRVVLQRAVVTMVANTVSVCVSLVHVVNIWAIVVFIQNTC